MEKDRWNFFNKALIKIKKTSSIVVVGSSVVLGVVVYQLNNSKKVYASWTTSYSPPNGRRWDSNWDRREPASIVKPPRADCSAEEKDNYNNKLEEATPTASRHIYLIRHGQYNDNGRLDKERYLTGLGREQADLTGRRMKALGIQYTSLTSSTMTRALETARIIQKYLPSDLEHDTDDSLREGAPIPPDPPIGSWRPEPQQFYVDGARIESAFRKYIHRAEPEQKCDTQEVIVCHANVIRYFVCRALQFEPEGWLRFSLAHASVTQLVVRPSGRVAVRCVGDAGFMPPDKISFS